jgi:CubicO group peptidase (beta-lactamase class C family)
MIIEAKFAPVADKFFELTSEQPFGGAALAIFQHGEPKLDIWAGDARPGRPWSENTKSVVFSTSKGLLSVLAHKLIEKGLLDPDEKVSRYWPEFGVNGKENISVAMIMRHRAGLSATREDMIFQDLQRVIPVEDALANQEPIWEPDSGYLYHAATIGHLLGKIIFNVTGMRVNEFLQKELARPLKVEAFFGAPSEIEPEIAELKSDDYPIVPEAEYGSPMYWGARAMTFGKAFTGRVDDFQHGFNDPLTHQSELAGAGGISNARSVAKIYSAVVHETDGIRLLTDETIHSAISRPNPGQNIFKDPAPYPVHSLGFIVANPEHSPVLSSLTFGHDGLGGQQGFADLEHRIGFGYTTNWIPMAGDGMARHREITRELKRVLNIF